MIAAEIVAKAPPDGYTLLLANVATIAIIPNMQKKPPYDPLHGFRADQPDRVGAAAGGRASVAAGEIDQAN